MKKIFPTIFSLIVIFFLSSILTSKPDYSIVFIHLGKSIPKYIKHAIRQARSFNKNCKIYLITDNPSIISNEILELQTIAINIENLPKSSQHQEFLKKTTLDRDLLDGFWLAASERFFILDDFIKYFNKKNIFHMEYDTMLYANLSELLPVFEEKYQNIAAVFDNDDRCVPCFVYVKNKFASEKIAACFLKNATSGKNDMQVMAILRHEDPSIIECLPIIMPKYTINHELRSTCGYSTKTPNTYSNNFNSFNSIFDAAALGQFLGGQDPRNGESKPGFINESCLFNASLLSYSWELDNQNRKIPYAIFDGNKCKINTLHIHSKKLEEFLS